MIGPRFSLRSNLLAILLGGVAFVGLGSWAMASETLGPLRFQPPFLATPESSKVKTTAEYWADTGLNIGTLDRTGYLTEKNCYATENQFHGCLAAIKALLVHSDPKLTIKPANAENLGKMISRFGPIVVVKVEKKEEPKSQVGISQFFKRFRAENNKENAAYTESFKDRANSPIDFARLYDYAKSVSLKDRSKEAMIAAHAVNAYRSETLDPHSYIISAEEFQKEDEPIGDHLWGRRAVVKVWRPSNGDGIHGRRNSSRLRLA